MKRKNKGWRRREQENEKEEKEKKTKEKRKRKWKSRESKEVIEVFEEMNQCLCKEKRRRRGKRRRNEMSGGIIEMAIFDWKRIWLKTRKKGEKRRLMLYENE